MDFGRLLITWSTLHKSEEGCSMQRSFHPAHQFDPEGRHDLKQVINPAICVSVDGWDRFLCCSQGVEIMFSSRACSMWWRGSVACRGWSQPGTRLVTHWLQPISASLWSPLILCHFTMLQIRCVDSDASWCGFQQTNNLNRHNYGILTLCFGFPLLLQCSFCSEMDLSFLSAN